jgi:uncharacterized membrane protein (DUF4010 family)
MVIPQILMVIFSAAVVIKSKNNGHVSESIQLQSPFALSPSIKFALGFAGLSVVTRFANLWAGAAGVYATALGGFISSAVVTASVSALAVGGHISYGTAALTAVLASIISTGNKMLLVKWSGPSGLGTLVNKTFTQFIIVGTIILTAWGFFISLL